MWRCMLPVVALLVGCEAAPRADAPADAPALLRALLDEDLNAAFERSPYFATLQGVPGFNHRLPDPSPEALAQRRDGAQQRLERARAIDPAALSASERVSHELLVDSLQRRLAERRYPGADALVLNTLGGIQSFMPGLAQDAPVRGAADLRDYIVRLEGLPRWADQVIARLDEGRRSGWMHAQPVLDRVTAAIDAQLVERPEDSVVYGPFKRMPPAVPEVEREALAAAARAAIAGPYQTALRRLKAHIEREVRPVAPADGGISALPGGVGYYAHLVRQNIVPDGDPVQIHALGLREVERIRHEVGELARRTGLGADADGFMRRLGSERRFFFDSADEVLAAYRAMPPRVDPHLPRLFHAVPRMPYGVRGKTAAEAASSTSANYRLGSLALGTPGMFTINALGYAQEARWRVETLFLHEAVPGHHLQGARAAEAEGLHRWRRLASWNVAYGEGWALYAEKLGFDMGLFTDPLQHYGHLQAELWRAARLVVDTGLHVYAWPRQRAVDYLVQQAGLNPAHAASEVDRYVSNPTQALGYLLGQRKFLELRERAQRTLGTRFDLRDFHAVVLDAGSMPLAVLERRVDAWIAAGGGRPAG